MRALLISTYDLGRQPFGLAARAASLRAAGADVVCIDASRDPVPDEALAAADAVTFYLPMHTATRLAAPLIARARAANPAARLGAYGLYAPINREGLTAQGVDVLDDGPPSTARSYPLIPDRSGLPALHRYAALQMPDGTKRVAGSTDATHGCKHLCRHCPIVPVYKGRFHAVPVDAVLEDIRAQVAAGAQHISFGDPDFLNGPTHARRIVERLRAAFPGLTFDVTIKIEHLLRHADMLVPLRDAGCLFVTSAVESVDDRVLEQLRKGHTRADFMAAAAACRAAGLTLVPTFVPFTPWTTVEGYVDLLDVLQQLDLVEHVAPIQLAIRLLVTANSALLELPDIGAAIGPFDAASLFYPWQHLDARVDALQARVMALVSASGQAPRAAVFQAIVAAARDAAGLPPLEATIAPGRAVPMVTEPWYCCAEPTPQQLGAI